MILTSQQNSTAINPNISTSMWKLSREMSGDKTTTPNITCPALSKIFDIRVSWLAVNTGFLVRRKFFTCFNYNNIA